ISKRHFRYNSTASPANTPDGTCKTGQSRLARLARRLEPIEDVSAALKQNSASVGLPELKRVERSTMTLPIFILAGGAVCGFPAKKFAFRDRQNLLHRFAEFLGWLWLGRCRHRAKYAQSLSAQL